VAEKDCDLAMCGICGKTNDPGGRAIAAMNGAMLHRGPDDEGSYVDPATDVAIGARRLSIIDVEGGHQPIGNEDGSVWAVLNGEIYNHPALRRHLEAGGHRLATGCDTEVLVHLYEDYGPDLVHALEGMFAFAIWDSRRGRLVVARDRFGEKPLFYAERGGELVFASELTALMQGAAGLDDLDPVAIDHFFVFGYVPGPRTMIQGVCQLPPAHLLTWDRASRAATVRSYWEPPVHNGDASPPWPDLVDEMDHLLEQSIRGRLLSDVPLGVFLSGGVDSALVAAMVARCSTGPVKTFTVGYEEGNVSETDPARAVAELLGTEHQALIVSSSQAAERAVAVLSAIDQPIADQALIALHAVAEFARQDVTVAVGGEGADELFGGYPRYRWLARGDRWARRLPAPLLHAGVAASRAVPLGSRTARLADAMDPKPLAERHIDWVTERRRHLRAQLYGGALRGRVDPEAVVDQTGRLLNGTGSGSAGIAERFMHLDQRHWLPDDVLAKADRATMLTSLEMRTPYLHREIAELAAAAPAATHMRNGGKAVVRELLRRALPGADVGRAKMAFRVPATEWLRRPLAGQLRRQARRGALCSEGWFDSVVFAELIDVHLAGAQDLSAVLWPLLALGLWLDRLRGNQDE
jgi:asparagine synthase (glutamine-hydrolysing)